MNPCAKGAFNYKITQGPMLRIANYIENQRIRVNISSLYNEIYGGILKSNLDGKYRSQE